MTRSHISRRFSRVSRRLRSSETDARSLSSFDFRSAKNKLVDVRQREGSIKLKKDLFSKTRDFEKLFSLVCYVPISFEECFSCKLARSTASFKKLCIPVTIVCIVGIPLATAVVPSPF